MASGMWTGMNGAIAQQQRLSTLSNNLANASTPGFKGVEAVFHQVAEDASKVGDIAQAPDTQLPIRFLPEDRLRIELTARVTDFRDGPLRPTGNPLDLAVRGEGFFSVDAPEGPLYTRNGTFSLDAGGKMVTQDGWPVRSVDGEPIVVPPGVANVAIDEDGRVTADEQTLGRLAIVKFANPAALERAGVSSFRNVDPTVEALPSEARVEQGMLEQSNVSAVDVMTALITTSRGFEMNMRAIQAYKAMDDLAAQEVGR